MPFVQGHLRRESLAVTFATECGHCHRALKIEIDSELQYRVDEQEADPLVFVPLVDFAKLKDLSIIDSF
jgi:hypothetical protein